MTVETTQKPLEDSPERNSLYPERPSFSAEKLLYEIEQLQSGDKPKEILTEEEFQEAKEFEAPFVEELAKLRSISIDMNILYPEYFDTPEGQVILNVIYKFTSIDKTADGFIDIRQNIHNLRNLDSDSLERLRGKSSAYNTQTTLDKLSVRITEEGDLDIDGLDNPEKLMFIKNPENLTNKIAGLRDLKSRLTQEMSNLFQIEASIEDDNKALIHYKISRLKDLIKKVNVLLAKALENQSILDAESYLSSHKPKVRLDKFRYGVGKMNGGNYDQVDNRLLQQADEITKSHIEINKKKESVLAEQGLDIKKIEKANIEPKKIKEYLDRILSDYGLLSEYPANADEVANNIKPPDNKWRCYIKPGQKTFEIDSKSKTLWIPIKKRSIADVLTKGSVHEIIHILQRENTAEIDIPLYTHSSQMGGDRSDLFQEGGAMYYQDKASQELFGFANPPLPHYLRAMAVKQAGGDYLACVKAYYKSSMSIKPEKESKKEEVRIKTLTTALSSAGRLFRNTPDLNNRNISIPSTKDTVYLEQKAVVEEIMINHPELRNIILVSGMNLETAKELIKFGVLDLSTLRQPDLSFVKELWEEMKDNYKLDNPTPEPPPTS
jgi:hypothetical protein